jgi:catalase
MTFIIGPGRDNVFARREDQPWPGAVVAPEGRSFDPVAPAGHFTPAGERYRALEDAERDVLIAELALALANCDEETKARMIRGFTAVDIDYGRRVFEALKAETSPAGAQ